MSGRRLLRAWAGGAVWTGLLVAALLFLDRRVVAPPPAPGWQRIELAAGELPYLPAYLPATLAWPPAEIWRRTGAASGQWLGVSEAATGGRRLWIGRGGGGLPPPMSELAGCRQEQAACPEGWGFLSTTIRTAGGDEEVQLLSDLGPREARRILMGLAPAHGPERP